MTPEQWADLRNFEPWENWGDWRKIEFEVIRLLDQYVSEIKRARGRMTRLEAYLALTEYPFTGIGIYPQWTAPAGPARFVVTSGTQGKHKANWHGKGLAIDGVLCLHNSFLGIHVDGRPVDGLESYSARWLGIEEEGKMGYYSVTEFNLKKYGVL